jgi:hypothetical protein
MNYKVMLAKVLSEKELADMDIKKIKEDDALLEELIRKEYALWIGAEKKEIIIYSISLIKELFLYWVGS